MSTIGQALNYEIAAPLYKWSEGRRSQWQGRNLDHLFRRKRARISAESCSRPHMLVIDVGIVEIDSLRIVRPLHRPVQSAIHEDLYVATDNEVPDSGADPAFVER